MSKMKYRLLETLWEKERIWSRITHNFPDKSQRDEWVNKLREQFTKHELKSPFTGSIIYRINFGLDRDPESFVVKVDMYAKWM